MRWVPAQFASAGEKFGAQFRSAAAVGEVPLTCRDNLEGLVTLFEELHCMGDLTWFTDEIACDAQTLHDALTCSM